MKALVAVELQLRSDSLFLLLHGQADGVQNQIYRLLCSGFVSDNGIVIEIPDHGQAQYGVDIISLDCDGWIDHLIPIWLENGVNTMFPIEVGTWNASIAPWREKYGKKILGVGGMNKNVFSKDRQAVDEEIERLKKLIALGGYIPCPDHRIAPDAKYELVQYYCDKMQHLS